MRILLLALTGAIMFVSPADADSRKRPGAGQRTASVYRIEACQELRRELRAEFAAYRSARRAYRNGAVSRSVHSAQAGVVSGRSSGRVATSILQVGIRIGGPLRSEAVAASSASPVAAAIRFQARQRTILRQMRGACSRFS